MEDTQRATNRLDKTVNVAVLIVMSLLGMILIKNYMLTDRTRPLSPIAVGEKLALPTALRSESERTVVLALSTTCHFCTDSVPFYRRLVAEATVTKTPVIAVFPQSSADVSSYLKLHELDGARTGSGIKLKIGGTPTLIVLNRDGIVTNVWQGKLPPQAEEEVISQLKSRS